MNETPFSPEGGDVGTLVSWSHALMLRTFSEQHRLISQFRGIQPQPFRIVAFTGNKTNNSKTTQLTPFFYLWLLESKSRNVVGCVTFTNLAPGKILSRSTSSNLLGSSAMLLDDSTRAYQVQAACSNSNEIKLLTIQFAAAGEV